MFCDEATIELVAGKGGKGCIGFRREKFMPMGGPNGGDGGDGGSLYLEADINITTLSEFRTHKIFKAKDGQMGLGKVCGGKDAEDLILKVPMGTTIYDEKKENVLGDLAQHGDRFLIARGGRGGYGNAHFKSSTRQAPAFAELGEPGEVRKCTLELKLVADVGIIGLPSVGKSTMISRISNARPKIAAYHFTTIVPNLGVVSLEPFGGTAQQSFVACDLPGLIEGAHEGKGLGIQFLKHVSRNRVLVHILDVTSADPSADFKTINKEMKLFDKNMLKKPMIVAFNKIDSLMPEDAEKAVKQFKQKNKTIKNVYMVSGVSGQGLKELMFAVWDLLEVEKKKEAAKKETPAEPTEYKVYRPADTVDPKSFEIKVISKARGKRVFQVTGRRLEQIVVMSDFNNPEAVARVYDVFEKMAVNKELARAGAKFGDDVIVGTSTITYRW
ncbi:GTPase ObgE [Candidatus Gracilibacteria bacterium]|nr:GTPase ObgE [Candidatus Gracilibacteria bacterium]